MGVVDQKEVDVACVASVSAGAEAAEGTGGRRTSPDLVQRRGDRGEGLFVAVVAADDLARWSAVQQGARRRREGARSTDEDLLARERGLGDRGADVRLVAVHLGGVDVPAACRERAACGDGGAAAAHLYPAARASSTDAFAE